MAARGGLACVALLLGFLLFRACETRRSLVAPPGSTSTAVTDFSRAARLDVPVVPATRRSLPDGDAREGKPVLPPSIEAPHLEVRVLDSAERPVPHAEVHATFSDAKPAELRWTDEAGIASFTMPSALATMKLSASSGGMSSGEVTCDQVVLNDNVARQSLTLVPRHRIRGLVVDEQGRRMAAAVVAIKGPLISGATPRIMPIPPFPSDAEGRFDAYVDGIGANVTLCAHLMERSTNEVSIAASPGAASDVVLAFPGVAVISGIVVTEAGAPVNEATVRLMTVDATDDHHPSQVKSDSAGRFRFEHLPAGDLIIVAAHDPLGFSNPMPLMSGDRPSTLQLVLRSAPHICGVVLTSEGVAVSDAMVSAYPTDDQAFVWGDFLQSSDTVLAKSTGAGEFCVEGLPFAKEYSVVWTPLPGRTSVTMVLEHVPPNASGLVLKCDKEHEKALPLRLRILSRLTAAPVRSYSVTVFAKLRNSLWTDVLTRRVESDEGILLFDPPVRGSQYLLLVMAPDLPVQLLGPIEADVSDMVGDVYLDGPASLEVAIEGLGPTDHPEVSVRFAAGVGPTWAKQVGTSPSLTFHTLGSGSYTITSPACAEPVQTDLVSGQVQHVTLKAKSN
jgi:hypothetical protein